MLHSQLHIALLLHASSTDAHLMRRIKASIVGAGLSEGDGGIVMFATARHTSRLSTQSGWKALGSTPAAHSCSTFTRLRQQDGWQGT